MTTYINCVSDCAVCTEGFAPGIAYRCRECSKGAKRLALGLSAVVGLAVLLLGALLCWRLGTVDNERKEEHDVVPLSAWEQRRWSCQTLPVKILPLSAIKIVVTVWQIIHQVCRLRLSYVS